MIRYIIKRLLVLIPMLLAIAFIIFAIMSMTPGEPAQLILGLRATPESLAQLSKEMGFDKPYLIRYFDYVINAAQGDLGNSWRSNRPVFDEIITRFPTTIKLAGLGILIALLIGVPLGILASVKQYSIFDITGTSTAMLMASLPSFWIGLMSILLFALYLRIMPSHGIDTWKHYVLPSITMALPVAANLLRLTRATMLETIRQDYISTARAKGQSEKLIIFRHALPNALLPVITVAGTQFCGMLGGVVTVEAVFSINGVGMLILESIRMKDIPLVTGCTLFLAASVMVMMLIVDILYAYIDPRIRALYVKR